MAEIPIMFWLVGWLLGCFGCEGLGGFLGFFTDSLRSIQGYALHHQGYALHRI